MKNKILIKFFEYLEGRAYRFANKITSHTVNSRKYLIENKKILPEKIHFIPNWIDIKPFNSINKSNSFSKKYGIRGKFVFLFAGVIGPSQGLDIIIKAARNISKIYSDICFLIVGDGLYKNYLLNMSKAYSLHNVIFKPLVPLEDYPELLKSVNVGLLCLSSKNKTPVVPGKIMGYMASSLPVVAFLNHESDGHSLIREAECGYSIFSDAPLKEIENLIIKVYKEHKKLDELGKNGHQYLLEHFEKKVCIAQLIKLISS